MGMAEMMGIREIWGYGRYGDTGDMGMREMMGRTEMQG
jgi:hypothetical protein